VTDRIAIAHLFLSLKIGGMEKISIDLIKHLDNNKYIHYIICLDELGEFGKKLTEEGYSIKTYNKGEGFSFRLFCRLIYFFKKNNIKIVHTNNPSPHFWGGIAGWLAGVKVRIHTKHGRNFIDIKRRVLLNRALAFFSTKVVSVSEDLALLMNKVEGVPKNKIMTIYNGINPDYFKKQSVKESLYHELNISKDNILVGSVARFNPDKDQKTLIEAFSQVVGENKNLLLLLVGDGITRPAMEKLSIDLGISENVIFCGYRTDVHDLLNLFDIYVLSTHTEGISISILEAMAVEKAVIATDVGGNSEIIEHNVNGLLVNENDVNGLAEAINILITKPTFKEQLSKEARKTVLEKFDIEKTAKEYHNLYMKYLNN